MSRWFSFLFTILHLFPFLFFTSFVFSSSPQNLISLVFFLCLFYQIILLFRKFSFLCSWQTSFHSLHLVDFLLIRALFYIFWLSVSFSCILQHASPRQVANITGQLIVAEFMSWNLFLFWFLWVCKNCRSNSTFYTLHTFVILGLLTFSGIRVANFKCRVSRYWGF